MLVSSRQRFLALVPYSLILGRVLNSKLFVATATEGVHDIHIEKALR